MTTPSCRPPPRGRNLAALLGLLLLVVPAAAHADEATPSPPDRSVRAVRVETAPELDGRLDDAVWDEAEATTGFTQTMPEEGKASTRRTFVKFVYTQDALYIGARMENESRDEIQTTYTRRDQSGNAERIIVSLDTWNDGRTAYSFALTAAGVRVDWYHPSDNEFDRDGAFDPVWEGATDVQGDGWTAEFRIPFSQLRFDADTTREWGVNINRFLPLLKEDAFWVAVPRDVRAWSSWFGRLEGIEDVAPPSRIELVPYVAADAILPTPDLRDADDPLDTAVEPGLRVGLDAKIGLGPQLNLDLTLNPDFGQVEADPAVVNLSAFETFYDERRPFFTEGNQLLKGRGPAFYYSRRIGASPRGQLAANFQDRPRSTPILSAAKLTGRLGSDLSVGGLIAATGPARARVSDGIGAPIEKEAVEPFTGHGVFRVDRQFGDNGSTVGASFTTVQRALSRESTLAAQMPGQAVAGGADFKLRTDGGDHELWGHLGGSQVTGTPEAMRRLQESSVHYFQRPDQGHVTLDRRATTLSGYAWSVGAARRNGSLLWSGGINAESPGFDINDAGQLSSADDIDVNLSVTWRDTTPNAWAQRWELNAWGWAGWNFGGHSLYRFGGLYGSYSLPNFWSLWVELGHQLEGLSDTATRGGPLMGTAPGSWIAAGFNSPYGQPVSLSGHGSGGWDSLGGWNGSAKLSLEFQITDRARVTLSPRFNRGLTSMQYVTTLRDAARSTRDTYDARFVFSEVDRSELALPVRLYLGLGPDLSVELWAEAFASSGLYDRPGQLAEVRTTDLNRYGTGGTTLTDTGGTWQVDEAGESFTISRPDFDVVSFRSNLVLRWEWRLGSVLYLVWQQDKFGFSSEAARADVTGLGRALLAPGEHVVAAKLTYWFPVD